MFSYLVFFKKHILGENCNFIPKLVSPIHNNVFENRISFIQNVNIVMHFFERENV